ncbi:ABC transporter ATP-binding protein [Burkholderia multivorans]|uniref:ABC transporter ATP-binding protein n=1 Tax=Burkholderia multivorans TaxID=87883 RepID=UPI0021C1F96B|nr:ABC transporter ATP-binding protein [Burkholderia multivorans]
MSTTTTTTTAAHGRDGATHARDAALAARSGWADLLQLARGQERLMLLTIVATVLAQGGMVATLAICAWLIGIAIAGAAVDAWLPGTCALVVAVAAGAGGRWWQAHVSHEFAFALIETMQIGIYDGLERAAPGYVAGRRTGELAAVATRDANEMEHFFAHTLADAIAAGIVPLLALVALAFVQPWLTLALLPFLPLLASVPFWLGDRAHRQGRALAQAAAKLDADVIEGIQGRKEIASFGQAQAWLDRVAARVRTMEHEQCRYGTRAGLEQAAIELLQAGALLAALLTGAVLVQHGLLAVAWLPCAVVLVGAALIPLAEVAQAARKLGELKAGAERILAIQRQPAQVVDRGTAEPADATVRFEQVGFAYDDTRVPALRGVDFDVKPAETVALVGASGAGKSTCVSLLLRFRDVQAGRVMVGGVDVRDMPLARLRQYVSVVPQDVYLFDDTIANNIRLGRPEADDAAVERAARDAQAHDFIVALPDGYGTRCGERGARLSGGQRQRIAIARALLRDSPVLVLDEASSSLDTESERAFHDALARLRRHRTVLMIAHRPSTIRQADRIVVLDDGRAVEQGTHAELVARGGRYARLLARDAGHA